MRQGSQLRPKVIEDVFEAVLAAIYLDHGLDTARTWLRARLLESFDLQDRAQFCNAEGAATLWPHLYRVPYLYWLPD